MSDKDLATTVKDLIPFIGLGAMGGIVRSINVRPFSVRELIIRMLTGSFAAFLAYLYLSTTNYSPALQSAICGAVGVLGTDLLNAIRDRMYKEITGESPHSMDGSYKPVEDASHSSVEDTSHDTPEASS